jgi:ribonuclease Z
VAGSFFADLRLVNGSTGDPVLFVAYPGRSTALLFDLGDNAALPLARLGEVEAVFLTHHHTDHFIGLDRLIRANIDQDKTLRVFGPDSTLKRVHQRLTAYEFPKFDFMKLVLEVHELTPGKRRVGKLECVKSFALGEVQESDWPGPAIWANADVEMEACPTDHTVPGLAYALIEKPGYHPDPHKLQTGTLRPGPWVAESLALLRARAKGVTVLSIDGVDFTLAWLRDRFFGRSTGARLTFIVDTQFSEKVKPGLLRLADKARRLYCDSYYSIAQAKQAAQHRHMTTVQAAELATLAGVEELVLIHFASRYQGRYHTLVEEARGAFPRTRAELS